MHEVISVGIVLQRNLPRKQTLVVCDEERGLIALMMPEIRLCQRIWPGMKISYALATNEFASLYRVIQSEIIVSAHCADYHALQAWNRLLSLALFFNERGLPNYRLYKLLSVGQQIIASRHAALFAYIEPWMSLRIVQDAGYWHPTIAPLLDKFFFNLSVLIDSLMQPEVELFRVWLHELHAQLGNEMQQWLIDCAKQHPCFAEFEATTTFITLLPPP